jgi:hypothetical protein
MVRDYASASLEAHAVYDRHVKPVEHVHQGEYVLVTPDEQTYFASTLVDVLRRGHESSNPRNFIFKVGDVALGSIR